MNNINSPDCSPPSSPRSSPLPASSPSSPVAGQPNGGPRPVTFMGRIWQAKDAAVAFARQCCSAAYLKQKAIDTFNAKWHPLSPPREMKKELEALQKKKMTLKKLKAAFEKDLGAVEERISPSSPAGSPLFSKKEQLATHCVKLSKQLEEMERKIEILKANLDGDHIPTQVASLTGNVAGLVIPGSGQVIGIATTMMSNVARNQAAEGLGQIKDQAFVEKQQRRNNCRTLSQVACLVGSLAFFVIRQYLNSQWQNSVSG